jgi:hypothetical protein
MKCYEVISNMVIKLSLEMTSVIMHVVSHRASEVTDLIRKASIMRSNCLVLVFNFTVYIRVFIRPRR